MKMLPLMALSVRKCKQTLILNMKLCTRLGIIWAGIQGRNSMVKIWLWPNYSKDTYNFKSRFPGYYWVHPLKSRIVRLAELLKAVFSRFL